MLDLTYTSQFEKDMKRIAKRGYNLQLMNAVLEKLCNEEPLEEIYKDHALKGPYLGARECHIQSDWLLIYVISKEEVVVTASRTGTHADLFHE